MNDASTTYINHRSHKWFDEGKSCCFHISLHLFVVSEATEMGPRRMGAQTRESGRCKSGKAPLHSFWNIFGLLLERPTAEISDLTFSGGKSMSSTNVLAAFSGLVTKSEEVCFGSGRFRRWSVPPSRERVVQWESDNEAPECLVLTRCSYLDLILLASSVGLFQRLGVKWRRRRREWKGQGHEGARKALRQIDFPLLPRQNQG